MPSIFQQWRLSRPSSLIFEVPINTNLLHIIPHRIIQCQRVGFWVKVIPVRKTAVPMKTARNTWPEEVAIYSIKNANEPANTVPRPLFNPLHRVAPIIC